MDDHEAMDIIKALGNETRLRIVRWLKDPEASFGYLTDRHTEGLDGLGGACAGIIAERAGISQSTGSTYLTMLQRAGLVKSERHGKWTYYSRDEEGIARLRAYLKENL